MNATEEGTDFNGMLKNFMSAKTVNLDGAPQWGSAQLEGQFQNEANWEQGAWSVKIFDLSKAEDIDVYAELLTTAAQQDPSVVILEQEKQFCKSSDNWKVFVTSVDIIYKQTVKNPEK